MEPITLIIFLASCFIGAIIQSVTGFGFGIFVMTIFPYFMPSYVAGVTVSTSLSLTMTIFIAFQQRKHIQFKLIAIPLIAYTISNTICVSLSMSQDDAVLKRMLGMFLCLLSIYFVFMSDKVKIKPTKTNGFIAGLLSGGLSGMFGAGGPPMVIYILSITSSPVQYLANIQCFFAISSIYNMSMRFMNGMVTQSVVTYWVFGLVALFSGVFVGKKLFTKLNPQNLKKLVYAFMAISGVIMVLTA